MKLGVRKTNLLRVAALTVVAASAGACSSLPSVPDWVDPTTWFGDDSSDTADTGTTPDLASVPDKPAASTPDEQHQVTEALAADRSHAQYSADALRGGTEAVAAPPPVQAPGPTPEEVAAATAVAERPSKQAPPPVQVAQVDRSVAQEPSGSSMPGALPSTPTTGYAAAEPVAQPVQTAGAEPPQPPIAEPPAAPVQPAPAPAPALESAPPTPRVAAIPSSQSSAPPVGAQPALPPVSSSPQQMAMVSPSDAALGFKPSSAPPLDPSISQFVPASIIDHYRATASNAAPSMPSAPISVAQAHPSKKLHRSSHPVAEGGPEHMSGAVVANLETLTPTTAPVTNSSPTVYANPAGLPATAVVFFPGDIVNLNAEARALVRAAVEQYRAAGGQGYIRVVGHSSSRTGNMPPEKHMEIIFRKSQDRANAVAQEIIREGVPADKVLVEAVGDSQPVYYESMPKGEDGNRRAEIFLQG